jgi:hypothetical protein
MALFWLDFGGHPRQRSQPRQSQRFVKINSALRRRARTTTPLRHTACSFASSAAKHSKPCPDQGQAARDQGTEQASMKHAASRELYAYWEERRGERAAPERAEIEPGAIRQSLGDAFILALDAAAGYPFRLAGTRVCALFGRELKGESFLSLWDQASRPAITDLIAMLGEERVGTVAAATASNGTDQPLALELLLLPLSASRASLARTIGVLAPLNATQWPGVSPIENLALGTRRHVGAGIGARFLPRFMAPRDRRAFIVHEGGRT